MSFVSIARNVNDPQENPKRPAPVWQTVGNYLSLAMLLPIATFVGYFIGYSLDQWLGTTWLSIVFLLLGIAAGLIELLRQVNKDKWSNGG